MANQITNDGVYLAKVMRDHLNTWVDKPCTFLLEDLGREAPSLMIQQLAAAEKKRTYVNGSYIGVWTFAVYMRINGVDTSTRLNALKVLDDLYAWLSKRDDKNVFINLPTIDSARSATQIIMPNTPSVAAKYEDGTEDYQAVYQLEYKYSVGGN